MKNSLVLSLLLFTLINFSSSCHLFHQGNESNKSAARNADSLVAGLIDTRSKVYQQVRAIKNDSSINKDTLAALRKQYEGVASDFNSIYNKVEKLVDSTKWNQVKCIVFKYKRVLAPHEADFRKAANQADLFNARAILSTGQSGNIITSVIPLIMPVLQSFAKERIQICKRDIERLNYDTWDKITKTN